MFDFPQYYEKPKAFDKTSKVYTACWRYALGTYDYSTFNQRLTRGKLTEAEVESVLKVFEKSSHYKTGDEPSWVPSLILTLVIGIGFAIWYFIEVSKTGAWWTLCFGVFYIFILSWLFALFYYIHLYLFHGKLLQREKAFMEIAREINNTLLGDKDVRIRVGYKSATIEFDLCWKTDKAIREKNPWNVLVRTT